MRFVALMLIIILANSNLHAQYSDEYLYNPRLAMSRDGSIIAVSGRGVSDPIARLGGRYPIDFYDTATGNLINSCVLDKISSDTSDLTDNSSVVVVGDV